MPQSPGPEHDTPPPDELSYEAAIEELESLIDRIERGEIGLEQSIEAYRRGTKLLQRCRTMLDDAQQQVETLESADEDQ